MRSVGNSVGPLLILVLSNLANIVGNVVLIPGLGPIPPLGAAGSAWATLGSRAGGALLGVLLLRSLREDARFRLLPMTIGASTCLKLLRVGIPSSLQLVFRALAVLGLSWLCGVYGSDALAALSIGIRLETLVLFAAFGWGGAASTVVAQNLGAAKPRRAELGSWLAAGLGAVSLGGIGALLFWKAPETVALFDAHPPVVEFGSWYLWLLTPSYAFLTMGVALSQALNGAGSTRSALAIDAFGLAVLLPAAWLLSRETPLGVKGIFAAASLTNVFLAGVYGLWFNTGRWKRKTLHL
jgi:Na+-driven multidrug efflux pump